MKKIFSLLIAMLLCTCVWAQMPMQRGNVQGQGMTPPKLSIEDFLKMRIDFIIGEMHLNTADSSKFAPVYAEMLKQKGESMQKHHNDRQVMRKIYTGQTVTDEEYMKAVDNEISMPLEEAQTDKAFVEKLKKILSPKQIYDYLRAERKFKGEMMGRRQRK